MRFPFKSENHFLTPESDKPGDDPLLLQVPLSLQYKDSQQQRLSHSLTEAFHSENSICHRTMFSWCSKVVIKGRAELLPFGHDLFQSCPYILDNETQQKSGLVIEETRSYRG